jgi:hypothetical protein
VSVLVAVYRAFPYRPHCSPARHVLLCRLIVPHLDGTRCPAKDA